MKILIREYNYDVGALNYTWKELRKENPFSGHNYCTKDGNSYNVNNILQVDHDFRKNGKYVLCGNCGKVIKKDDKEKHYNEVECKANCMSCDWLRLREVDGTAKHKMMPDGKVATRQISVPYCSRGYYYSSHNHIPIADVDKASTCKWYACRRAETIEFRPDIFTMFPNPFRKLLTEKAVIDNGWKYNNRANSETTYRNSDGKVFAVFDTNGILIRFFLKCRSATYAFRYSDTHDKFLDAHEEFCWNNISDTRIARYEKQIRKLYGR